MPHLRLLPDAISFNSAIIACEQGSEWQLAVSLLLLGGHDATSVTEGQPESIQARARPYHLQLHDLRVLVWLAMGLRTGDASRGIRKRALTGYHQWLGT